jgi:hypothetical protein
MASQAAIIAHRREAGDSVDFMRVTGARCTPGPHARVWRRC